MSGARITRGPEAFVLWHVAVAIALLFAGLLGLDRAIAEYFHASGFERIWILDRGTLLLDTVSGKELSKFLPGLVLIGAGLAALYGWKSRRVGWSTLYVGVVQLSATLITGVSKNFFGRLRPFQLFENGEWSHAWFVGGSSFPSGHAGFYFGLFLPLACVFPRWRWPLMIVPWFIAAARVNANDHFMSDVAASIAVTGLLTLWLARVALRRAAIGHDEPRVSIGGAA
jgi:membrane-associated phospholipid phosphatase